MKITFEGKTIGEVLDQMQDMLKAAMSEHRSATPQVSQAWTEAMAKIPAVQGPGPEPFAAATPVENPVEIPVEKTPAKPKIDRVAAMNKARAAKEAKKAAAAMPAPVPEVPPPASAKGMDPADIVKLRQKTIEDLQSAYANGYQKEVFELLSRFGNGAKSFRELPPDAFVPIREAIDNGALT